MKFVNFDFDISAIIINIVILTSYFLKKRINSIQNRVFLAMMICSLIATAADIVSGVMITEQYAWLPVVLSNTIFYFASTANTILFMVYIFTHMNSPESFCKINRIILSVPILLIIVLITVNPLTGWLFSYNSTFENNAIVRTFQFGPLFLLLFALNFFYFLCTFIYSIHFRNIFSKAFRYLIYAVCTVNLAAEIIQIKVAGTYILALAFSVSMLITLLSIEKYGIVVNPETGVAKRDHLDLFLATKVSNRQPFYLMLIRMADFDHNSISFGFETIEKTFEIYEKLMVSYTGIGKTFKISNSTHALFFDAKAGYQGLQEMLYEELKKPVIINNMEVSCEFYISTIAFPENQKTKEGLFSHIQSFTKMNFSHYGIVDSMNLLINDKIREKRIELAIENAFNEGNFHVFYQPICTAKEQKFITAEALLRLYDSELGMISPEDFIPVSERNGSIIKIGKFVLENVCRFIRDNDMEELGLEYIEMNLSTVQVLQRNFIETIDEITREYGVSSNYLCFEITETASNMAPAVFTENLKLLNERGYILALDDFGTGYGNLQRMVSSDFGIVKFDKYMTQQLSSGDQLKKVYKTLQAMIQTMGSKVVSEGVETQEQYEFIRDAGGSYIQGFFFSKPLPEQDFIDFIREKNSSNN